ncbi:MAG: hypothetical protein PVI41_08090 [Roseobacter sp.]|jgi:hypothetical protein
MKTTYKISAVACALVMGTAAHAQPADAICAVEQIIACEAFQPCERSLPGGVNMPALIKLDHTNGVVVSRTMAEGDRTSAIAMTEELDIGYVISGVDEGNGWSFRLAEENGRFTFATAHDGVAYVGFGVCASE